MSFLSENRWIALVAIGVTLLIMWIEKRQTARKENPKLTWFTRFIELASAVVTVITIFQAAFGADVFPTDTSGYVSRPAVMSVSTPPPTIDSTPIPTATLLYIAGRAWPTTVPMEDYEILPMTGTLTVTSKSNSGNRANIRQAPNKFDSVSLVTEAPVGTKYQFYELVEHLGSAEYARANGANQQNNDRYYHVAIPELMKHGYIHEDLAIVQP